MQRSHQFPKSKAGNARSHLAA